MKEFTEEKEKGRYNTLDGPQTNNNKESKQDNKMETFNISFGDDLENQLYQTQNKKNWKVMLIITIVILIGLLEIQTIYLY
jgi:hypothetical protein